MGALLQDDSNGGAAPKLHQPTAFEGVMKGALIGLTAVSAAVTLAASEPPHWLHRDAYFAALSGTFFAGVVQVTASICAADGNGHAAGRKLMYASLVAPLVIAGCVALSSLPW